MFRSATRRMMSSRTPIVGGNWKMNAGNGVTKASVMELLEGLNAAPKPACEVYLGVPFVYLEAAVSARPASPHTHIAGDEKKIHRTRAKTQADGVAVVRGERAEHEREREGRVHGRDLGRDAQ